MNKKQLQVLEFHLLWNNQNEQKIKILSKDKETALDYIKRNTKDNCYIDKIYSQAILVNDIDYFDDLYIEVFDDE